MADIRPFLCYRPRADIADEVAALPYDVFNRHEALAEIETHPQSFLRIDKTAALFGDAISEYDPQIYERAAEIFNEDLAKGVFIADEAPYYYLYRLKSGDHAQIGVVAAIAVEDYLGGVIKRHENTRQFKLEDRIKHIEALGAQTGPVLVAYRPQELIDKAMEHTVAASAPINDFTSDDGIGHTVWRVDDAQDAANIQKGFDGLEQLYIADGHHRAAAAVEIGRQSASTEAKYFMMVAFASNELKVYDYNRVVFDKNGLSLKQLLGKIAEVFTLEEYGEAPYKPAKRGEFGMYVDGLWYKLTTNESLRPDDAVNGLDVSLLQELLLDPILGVDDPRSSKRIAYVGGVRGLTELKRRADQAKPARATAEAGCSDDGADGAVKAEGAEGANGANGTKGADKADAEGKTDGAVPETGGVAFALYPCSLDELFDVADMGKLMPPKSTWFEPKPRSGLFIHKI